MESVFVSNEHTHFTTCFVANWRFPLFLVSGNLINTHLYFFWRKILPAEESPGFCCLWPLSNHVSYLGLCVLDYQLGPVRGLSEGHLVGLGDPFEGGPYYTCVVW